MDKARKLLRQGRTWRIIATMIVALFLGLSLGIVWQHHAKSAAKTVSYTAESNAALQRGCYGYKTNRSAISQRDLGNRVLDANLSNDFQFLAENLTEVFPNLPVKTQGGIFVVGMIDLARDYSVVTTAPSSQFPAYWQQINNNRKGLDALCETN